MCFGMSRCVFAIRDGDFLIGRLSQKPIGSTGLYNNAEYGISLICADA